MDQQIEIEVENLKCGGCARSIVDALSRMSDVEGVEVDRESRRVRFSGNGQARARVAEKLASMGYPEKGTVEGLGSGLANAKSFVSCAMGRMAS